MQYLSVIFFRPNNVCFIKNRSKLLIVLLLCLLRIFMKQTLDFFLQLDVPKLHTFPFSYHLEISPVYTAQTVSSSSYRNDFSGWNLLCQAIDRVLFISYLAIILIFIASYLRRTALASQSWKNHGLTVHQELNPLFKMFSVELLGMCLFGNVPFLECTLFGMSCIMNVPFSKRAFFGICPFWNVFFLECALFGMCLFWNVHFLECALFCWFSNRTLRCKF